MEDRHLCTDLQSPLWSTLLTMALPLPRAGVQPGKVGHQRSRPRLRAVLDQTPRHCHTHPGGRDKGCGGAGQTRGQCQHTRLSRTVAQQHWDTDRGTSRCGVAQNEPPGTGLVGSSIVPLLLQGALALAPDAAPHRQAAAMTRQRQPDWGPRLEGWVGS